MPEADKEGERYSVDEPQQTPGFSKARTSSIGACRTASRAFSIR